MVDDETGKAAVPPSIYDAEATPEAARSEIDELLASGDLARYRADSESAVAKLEREFAEFMGIPFALAVSSCSSALFLSLKAIDIALGDKVLVPAFTFAAVPSAVVHAGGEPILVEVAYEHNWKKHPVAHDRFRF
jgi:dTDP-4-amino-4,6-dideoxygalactose transaminase